LPWRHALGRIAHRRHRDPARRTQPGAHLGTKSSSLMLDAGDSERNR
jgi:hypothetical protein